MGWLSDRYSRPGPGISKDEPPKKGVALFFSILWRELSALLQVNLLFLLFSLPIVTMPAAYTAMTRVSLRMVRDESYFLWQDFWATFRAEWKRSMAAGLLVTVGMVASSFSVAFYLRMTPTNAFFYLPVGLALGVLVLLMLISIYLYPMLALVDLPLKSVFQNAFLLSFLCLKNNLLALLCNGLIGFVLLLFFPVSIFFWFCGYFALVNLIATFFAYGGIQKYVLKLEGE